MFTELDIQKEVSASVFSRGRQLHMMGNVQSIQIIDMYMGEQKCDRVKALMQGSSWRCYNLNIIVDYEHGKIMSHECDCPAHDEFAGMCKHCVAVLLRYIQVKNDQARKYVNPPKKIVVEMPEHAGEKASYNDSNAKTDIGLYRIIMGNGLENQLQYRQNNIRHRVHLQPILHNEFGKWFVEFRIGINQMYVLKNIMEFDELMRTHELKKYGTKLEFYHHESAFAKDSIELLHFILKIAQDIKSRGNVLSYQYFSLTDSKRQIPLVGLTLDEFMSIISDKEFLVASTFSEENVCKMTDDELKIKMFITGKEDGINLYTEHYEMSKGSEYQYIYDNEKLIIYRCLLNDIKKIYDFREYMNRQNGRESFIASKDLPVFCRDLLPELEKHYDIDYTDFDKEKYTPRDVKFELYLDMPEHKKITCNLKAVYDDESYPVFSIQRESKFIDFSVGVITENRNVEKEMEADMIVSSFLPMLDEKHGLKYLYGDEDEIYQFLTEGMEELSHLGDIYVSEAMRRTQILSAPRVSLGASLKSNLLELSLSSEDMPIDEIAEILSGYTRKKKYFRLKNGSFVNMDNPEFEHLVTLVSGFGLSKTELKKGNFVVPKYRAMYLDTFGDDSHEYITKDDGFRALIANMQNIEGQEYELPDSLKDIMRGYQKSGFKWLEALHNNGFGGILADDMGLGKTLQIISFLLAHKEEGNQSLVVCPASLVYNWESEFNRFAPELKITIVAGDIQTRKDIIANSRDSDIIVTSYDLLKRDVEQYENHIFFAEIIDEAQYIKNQNTQAAHAVKMIKAGTKFALTGTPMENRLSELWSIFDYLMPGFLYSYRQFREKIEVPILESQNSDSMGILRKLITPFVLRRLKKDVLKDLPDKVEEVIYAKLEGKQLDVYNANASRLRKTLNKQTEKEFRESKIQILAELTRLRQLCCNPELVYDNYKGEAAKMEVCIDLIRNAIGNGHKILVFSQFTSMLELLIAEAKKEGISYYVLTGQTPKEERIELVENFNNNDTSVFFISLKAGGTGLNLTSADIVIHFDPWWNIAAQNQATDRTHRIGQRNVVTVYKLIAKNTIEEKILELQEKKKELADKVLSGEDMDRTTFTREELMELLNF